MIVHDNKVPTYYFNRIIERSFIRLSNSLRELARVNESIFVRWIFIPFLFTDYTNKYNITLRANCTHGISKSAGESIRLFKPHFAFGLILVALGIFCIWIEARVISLKEEGKGFKIIGIRFLIGGIVSVTLGFLAKCYLFVEHLLKQISHKIRLEEDERSDWYMP